MKLMRNVTPDGQCKYAAVRMDKLALLIDDLQHDARTALWVLESMGLLENPKPGEQEEFFLVKLKDRNAPEALRAYAEKALPRDQELADDVAELANRAGINSPWCKEPDTDPRAYGVPGADDWQRPDNTCPRCKQPAFNLFRTKLPGDELDTTHCGCLYRADGVKVVDGTTFSRETPMPSDKTPGG